MTRRRTFATGWSRPAVAATALLLSLTGTSPGSGSSSPDPTDRPAPDPAATVIARYRDRIPELMADQDVPGLAVALVDRDGPLWVEGFGVRDRTGGAPVTVDTIFSVQSMSKLFTATAVMQAVAAGRLDLDEPITSYLPAFTVHSAFEEHPERKITLRMLLSHTAGFTHEAPVGNNNELDPGTFEAHVHSISDTWLRFPVGTGYAYSNLGIDLAGHILEVADGKPFAEDVRDSLLAPLGMDRSTFDRAMIRSTVDRAIGHVEPYPHPPLYEPMTAAGGLYSSAADLARFLDFELGAGSVDHRVVLERRWTRVQRTVQAPRAGAPAGYALGVVRHEWNRFDQRPDLFDHGGGGYGFLSDLWWAPQLGVGIAVLTNSQDHHLQGDLALSILGDLVTEPGSYHDRLLALPTRPAVPDPDLAFALPADLAGLVESAAMPPTDDRAARWASYSGPYVAPAWGVLDPLQEPDRFIVRAGVAYFEAVDDRTDALVRHRLAEIEPGLFLADNGETLDLRAQVPTWGNFRLVRVSGGPNRWQWAVLGTAALGALTWLVAAAVRSVSRLRSPSGPTRDPTTALRWPRVAAVAGTLTAVLAIGDVVLVALVPRLVGSGFLGWLALPLAPRLALHLPLALSVLSAGTLTLTASGWLLGWWSPAVRLQYVALAVGSASVVAQLAAWDLIGWGLS